MSINTPLNGPLATDRKVEPTSRRTLEHAVSFDYLPTLNTKQSEQLFQITQNIKRNQRTAIQAIIEAGQDLLNVKKMLDHGDFGAWLDHEFAMSERTAQNLMSVADRFKSATVADLPINIGALYELAAPSTPDPVVEQVIERAQAGERITRQAVTFARNRWGHRIYSTPAGFSITVFPSTDNPKFWYAKILTPDNQTFSTVKAEPLPSRSAAVHSVADLYRATLSADTYHDPVDPVDQHDDADLPNEPLSDLIFAVLDDGEDKALTQIFNIVRKDQPEVTAHQIGEELKRMVADQEVVKRNPGPGARVTYLLNGHSVLGGQRVPTLEDDREAILSVLDKRPRNQFYLGQLSRWSGINDLARTRIAVNSLPEVLSLSIDLTNRAIYQRVDAATMPTFIDASIPDADEIYDLISQHGDAMPAHNLTEHFEGLTFADMGALLNVVHADPRLKLGAEFIFTDSHPNFNERSPELPDADGTRPAPVEIPGQQALRDDIQRLRAEQAMPTLITFDSLLGTIESALSAFRVADLHDLRLADDAQRVKLAQRINQHRDRLHAFQAQLDNIARAIVPTDQDMTFAESLENDDHAAQSERGDQIAGEKAVAAAATIPTIQMPARKLLPEKTS